MMKIDDLTTGLRPLKDTDSSDSTTTYDPNLKNIMVDDPATGRRPAKFPSDLWNYGGLHQSMMVDDLAYGRHPMGSDPLAALLNSSGFYAPLKSTLVLTRGTGSATYTRATASTEFDNEGKLITIPSGAARFGGARMVRNLLTYSEDFSNAVWNLGAGATKTGTNQINFPADIAASVYHNGTFATSKVGDTGTASVTLSGSGNIVLVLYDNGGAYPTTSSANIALTGTPTRYQVSRTHTDAAATRQGFSIKNNAAAVATVYVTQAQLENVTGQADQTADGYVSTNVLSAPFHGAGIDGVKYFETNKDGSAISDATLLGYHAEGARTNNLLYSRDLTKAAWTATNVTPAKTATGIDGAANSATTLTAGAADAIILQTITMASAARSASAYVKRRTGTGNVYMTRDGGTNWTDITSLINASTYTRVKIENTSVTDPSVGFKISTSGDAIDVDVVQDEAGTFISSPIITTTAAVTRNADALTYQTASNWSDTVGWVASTKYKQDWSYVAGVVIGSATNGLLPLTTNTGVKAYDGTNTVNGPTGTPSGSVKVAMNWGSGALQVAANGTAGTAGSYDGAWGLSSIGIAPSAANSFHKNVYIGQAAITASQLAQVTA